MEKLKFISLFAGIGGLDLGLERAGMECVAQVEINPFCQKVLTKHWPNVPKFGDIRDAGKHNLPATDLICGGFPCQPHSFAGKRKASEDTRDLWGEFYRIICECRPKWIMAENVPGLLSSENGRFFGRVLRDLAGCGYDAEWQSIPAAAFGAPHIRERVFILAYSKSIRSNDAPIINSLECQKSKSNEKQNEFKSGTRLSYMGNWSENEPPRVIRRPKLGRMVDGLSVAVDRLQSIGNSVVPVVGEYIGLQIINSL